MDIEKFIEKKCPDVNEDNIHGVHDRAYAHALRGAYLLYKDIDNIEVLKLKQMMAREDFRLQGSTHSATARCVILMEMIDELKRNN